MFAQFFKKKRLQRIELDNLCVIIDAGHSRQTPGKKSPDGRLEEWKWNRETRDMVVEELDKLYIQSYNDHVEDVTLNGSENADLKVRVERANKKIADNTKKGMKSVYVSIHVNAAGDGKEWKNARGWSIWTTKGQNNSDKLASAIYDSAKREMELWEQRVREDMQDGDPDYESNFYVIKNVNCTAVLVENFFMDNKDDVEWLLSEECKRVCARVIVMGILKYASIAE